MARMIATREIRRAATVAVALLVIGLTGARAEQGIGAVSAANPRFAGVQEGGVEEVKSAGDIVFSNERIVTSDVGSGQLLFDDKSTLTIAPNSDLVLDRYVYDPDRGAGDIGLSLTRGALRFIGGRISKSEEATVRTPTATIGIRGGMALISVDPDGSAVVIHMAGEQTRIDAGTGAPVVISREGGRAEIGAFGARYTGVASREEIERRFRRFEVGRAGPARPNAVPRAFTAAASGEVGGASRGPVSTFGAEPRDSPFEDPNFRGDQIDGERALRLRFRNLATDASAAPTKPYYPPKYPPKTPPYETPHTHYKHHGKWK